MSKLYLQRTVDSFTKDFPKSDEKQLRDIILRNAEELTDPARIASVLQFDGRFADQIRLTCTLEAFVNRPNWTATEQDVVDSLGHLEQDVLDKAAEEDSLRYEDAHNIAILRDLLAVALDDEIITHRELKLLRTLRDILGLSELTFRVVLAQLNHFPRHGNALHTPSECREALVRLQRDGVVFYCNKMEPEPVYVIPNEIRHTVMKTLDLELGSHAWGKLLDALTVPQLGAVLAAKGLPQTANNKNELKDRIMSASVKPSFALSCLKSEDLHKLCSALPGVKVSGTKAERIDRIVRHFYNLRVKAISPEAEAGERYFSYLPELARRDRENLLANGIISKDKDIEQAFEDGTTYLFEKKLRIELMDMSGSDHPDGCALMGGRRKKTGDVVMWDNKSSESAYTFPPAHLNQFKRYVRDSVSPVACFLIIIPEADDTALTNAWRLKAECAGTDVALIDADTLVWLAKEWQKRSTEDAFDLEMFVATGILTRTVLEQRLKLFS